MLFLTFLALYFLLPISHCALIAQARVNPTPASCNFIPTPPPLRPRAESFPTRRSTTCIGSYCGCRGTLVVTVTRTSVLKTTITVTVPRTVTAPPLFDPTSIGVKGWEQFAFIHPETSCSVQNSDNPWYIRYRNIGPQERSEEEKEEGVAEAPAPCPRLGKIHVTVTMLVFVPRRSTVTVEG